MSDALLLRIALALETLASAPVTGLPGTTASGAGAKPATAPAKPAAAKPATAPAKPAAPAAPAAKAPAKPKPLAGDTKAEGGKHTQDQVREMIRKIAAHPDHGRQSAFDILDAEAGVKNVSDLKTGDYDKVYEACADLLKGESSQDGAEEFDDPTA